MLKWPLEGVGHGAAQTKTDEKPPHGSALLSVGHVGRQPQKD